MREFFAWLRGLVRDPATKDPSSARVCALGLAIVGCIVALKHPEHPATVAALIGGGAAAIITRSKINGHGGGE